MGNSHGYIYALIGTETGWDESDTMFYLAWDNSLIAGCANDW